VHGNPQAAIRMGGQNCGRQAPRFAAKNQHVVRTVLDLSIKPACRFCEKPWPELGKLPVKRRPIIDYLPIKMLPIVQSRPMQMPIVEPKPQWSDQP